MKEFLRQLLTSTLAYILGSVLLLLFLFIIISGRISSATEKSEIEIAENSILLLRMEGMMEERGGGQNPFAMLGGESGPMNLQRILQVLEGAKDDERIRGAFIDVRGAETGYASAEALRNALKEFRAAGKFIIVHGEVFTEKNLFAFSVADSVFLYPTGMVEWNGLVSNQMFLRGMLDRWGLEPMLFRVGSFKSAAENITERQMSTANREQITTLLNDMWNHMLKGIAQQRGTTPEVLDSLAARFSVVMAQEAVDARLVDGLRFEDQVRAAIRNKLGIGEEADIRAITVNQYYDQMKVDFDENKIAVIYAVGEIQYGEGDAETIGNISLCRQLRTAREDENVKAVVLRINSPGGSALASDMIWREIILTKAKKPVIASMGDVAASGGYYIAAPCDRIFAEPTTITGSIGVIGLLLNSEKFFTRELGVTFDRAYSNQNQYADLGNPNRPMTDYERDRIQRGVDQIYRQFLTVVAQGRGFANADSVHPIAQGRVWSGARALELKLVDELGGLHLAIKAAAQKAGVEQYRLLELPRQGEPLEELLKSLKGEDEDGNEVDVTTAPSIRQPADTWAQAEQAFLRRNVPAEYSALFRALRLFSSDPTSVYLHTGNLGFNIR
jgi:protease-4